MTTENLFGSIKTLGWVIPLTVLIWVYAEREQVQTDVGIVLPISIRSDDPQKYVTLETPKEKVVVATLTGSRENLDKVEQALQHSGGENSLIQIPIAQGTATGPVPTSSSLAKIELFKRNGVTVGDCSPVAMIVDVDTLTTADVTVQVPPELASVITSATFTPATVKVRGPANEVKSNRVAVYADLAGFEVLKHPGDHPLTGVHLKPPSEGLTFTPTEISADITVRESDISYDSKPLSVWVDGPAEKLAKSRVECDPTYVRGVKIYGPPDKIKQLADPDFPDKPRAVLEIKPSDDPGAPVERQVRIELPPNMGLHLSPDDDSARTVKFRVVDVSPAE